MDKRPRQKVEAGGSCCFPKGCPRSLNPRPLLTSLYPELGCIFARRCKDSGEKGIINRILGDQAVDLVNKHGGKNGD